MIFQLKGNAKFRLPNGTNQQENQNKISNTISITLNRAKTCTTIVPKMWIKK